LKDITRFPETLIMKFLEIVITHSLLTLTVHSLCTIIAQFLLTLISHSFFNFELCTFFEHKKNSWLQVCHIPMHVSHLLLFLAFSFAIITFSRFYFHMCHFFLFWLLYMSLRTCMCHFCSPKCNILLEVSPTHFIALVNPVYHKNMHWKYFHGRTHVFIAVNSYVVKTCALIVALGD